MLYLYRPFSRFGLIFIFSFIGFCGTIRAQLVVNSNVTVPQLISALAGQGLTVSNVTLNCPAGAYGTFNGTSSNIGMNNGILLTTGDVNNAVGPNFSPSTGTCNGTILNDPQLQSLEPLANEDVCILEFDLVPQCNSLQIRFVFGSEEYPEFVNSGFNDAFGFFITGAGPACQPNFYSNTNVATLPNNTTIVTIDNVNNVSNNTFYVDNTGGTTVQYDGFTTVLTRTVSLCPCTSYHFKIAIGDAGDCFYDSGVFLDFIQCANSVSATSVSTGAGCTCNGTATATASGGTSPYTYSWAPSGQTTATATGLCAGTYTCFVSDALSCTTPVQTVVTVTGSSITSTQTQQNVACNGGSNGTATANPSGGTAPYSYSWSPGGQTNQTATGLSAGTYTVVITDANGCSTTQTVTITQPTVLSAPVTSGNPSCFGGSNGTATVSPSGGTAGYTYQWTPGGGTGATATGLTCGSYTILVTDANGCTATNTVTLTCPAQLTASSSGITNPTCGNNNGSATVTGSGGTPGYSYNWAPSGGTNSTATGLGSGSYTVTITDANGCTATQTVTLNNSNGPSATLSATNIQCNGQCTGTASSNVTGGTSPYTYSWSNSQTTTGISNLCAGTYTLVATDAMGCTVTQTVTVTQPAAVTASAISTNVTCFGNTDGTATVSGGGGTAPYTYNWSPSGGTNASATGLSCGTYTVTVTDANNCTQTASVTITCPTALATTISGVVNTSCANTTDGSATVNASGGTPGYSYTWAPSGGTNATASNLGPGTYTVTVTDANGCTTTATATIASPAAIVLTAAGTATLCIGQSTVISASASGGSSPYTYSWAPNNQTSSSVSVNPTITTTYTVFVTDANGCTGTQQTVTITVNPPLALNLLANPSTVCAGSSTTITANGSGGNGNYTYSWAPSGNGTSVTVTPTATTTYTVTVSDNCGTPVASTTVTITVAQPPTACIQASDTAGCAPFCVNFTSCGSPAVTWSWTFSGGSPSSSTQQNPSNVCFSTPGLYNVSMTLTSAAGCVGSTTSNSLIHVYANPVAAFTSGSATASGVPVDICFTNTTTGATTWTWASGSNTSSSQNPCFTFNDTGIHCITLLAANQGGCTDTTTHCIRVEIDSFALEIPNVFTPNNDGKNDVFMINSAGVKELEIWIYNRWGTLIYEGNALTTGWDGKAKNGNMASDGTYYWVLRGLKGTGDVIDEKGFLTLLSGR